MTSRLNPLTVDARGWASSGRQLLSNTGLVVSAEMVNRITRIATTLALAYAFDVLTFGFAVAALTTHELARMLLHNGLGTRIVASGDGELQHVAAAAYRLNWLLAWALVFIQALVAVAVGYHFNSVNLGMAILTMALVHVIYPFSMVQVYLAQRANRWALVSKQIAFAAAGDNLLTALLALSGFGLWAIVFPKITVALLWVYLFRRQVAWSPSIETNNSEVRRLAPYGLRVFGVELLAGLRLHGDKMIVGMLFGPIVFGIYSFASNIGRGIPQSFSMAFATVVLPVLRRARDAGDMKRSYVTALCIGLLVTLPFSVGLAITADWLVPLVFGEKWAPATELLSIFALGAVAMPLLAVTSQYLRASDRVDTDLSLGVWVTTAFLLAFVLALPHGTATAAIAACAAQALATFVAITFLLREAQLQQTPSSSNLVEA